jgi:hypothetical protein
MNTVRAGNLKRLKKSRPNQQIAAQCDPLRVAQNSRSFRRFLRVAGHADYLQQSKLPA